MDYELKPENCPKSRSKSVSDRVLRSHSKIEHQQAIEGTREDEEKQLRSSVVLIYLDLSQSTAIVRREPAAAAVVDDDAELKRCLDCFLGVRKARRLLYSPSTILDDINNNAPVLDEPVESEQPKSERMLLPRIGQELKSFPLVRLKLFVENVQRLNAEYFEQQTPKHLKEPFDLADLPDEQQRTRFCREHKALVQQIHEKRQEQNLICFDFLSSLSSDTPLAMCHPLALSYRQQSFDACRAALADSLFGLLNHEVFYCGLRQRIEWLSPGKLHGNCILSIGSDLQRRARFQLSSHIRAAGDLIETLLHEMCHAAAFVYNGELAHGLNTRKWVYRAKSLLPQLPLVANCAPSCRYSCRLCRRSACGNIRFRRKQQQLLRCFYCQFELVVSVCSEDSAHELRPTAQSDTSYTNYIRNHYTQCAQSGHSSKMRSLNAQYCRQH